MKSSSRLTDCNLLVSANRLVWLALGFGLQSEQLIENSEEMLYNSINH